MFVCIEVCMLSHVSVDLLLSHISAEDIFLGHLSISSKGC